MKRITIRNAKSQRTFTLPNEPYPERGDSVEYEGKAWQVVKVEEVEPIVLRVKKAEG